jgi:flagellar hook-basal body complex protein FliE
MNIEGIKGILPQSIQPTRNSKPLGGLSFGNTLNDLIKDVNTAQIDSQKAVEGFVGGEGVELHEVMIAGAKAKTSLELLMEVRNKAVDMFKELTRTPV